VVDGVEGVDDRGANEGDALANDTLEFEVVGGGWTGQSVVMRGGECSELFILSIFFSNLLLSFSSFSFFG